MRLRFPPLKPTLVARACVLLLWVTQTHAADLAQPSHRVPSKEPSSHWFVDAELGVSLLSDRQELFRSVAGGLRGGYRFDFPVGVFLEAELNAWRSTTLEIDETEGVVVLNIGAGVEYRYAGGFARTSFSIGPSILTQETTVDASAGSVGIYFHARPVGLLFPFLERYRFGLDPLTLYWAIPDLGGIPLQDLQLRTSIYAEVRF